MKFHHRNVRAFFMLKTCIVHIEIISLEYCHVFTLVSCMHEIFHIKLSVLKLSLCFISCAKRSFHFVWKIKLLLWLLGGCYFWFSSTPFSRFSLSEKLSKNNFRYSHLKPSLFYSSRSRLLHRLKTSHCRSHCSSIFFSLRQLISTFNLPSFSSTQLYNTHFSLLNDNKQER